MKFYKSIISTADLIADITVNIAASVGGALLIPLAIMVTLFILCIYWKRRQRKRQLQFNQEVNTLNSIFKGCINYSFILADL